MFCANCGNQQEENAHKCTSCGGHLHASPPTTQYQSFADPGSKAPTFLVPSILVTIFCCQIFGIVAIVYSAIAMGKNSSGDYSGAQKAADSAKLWCWIGFGIGFVIMMLYVVLAVIGAAATTP